MGTALDYIFTFGSLLIGLLFLTGHGGIFMKGGNEAARKAKYDEKKMEKATGVALIIVGVITGIDMYTDTVAAKIIYIVALIVIFAGLFFYLKKKCMK